MTKLPNEEFRKLVPKMREKGFYKHQVERPTEWSAYTVTEVNTAAETIEFIRDAVDKAELLKTDGKVGRPLTDPKSLAKAVLLCEALGFTERQAEGWLRILGPCLGIREKLDDKTIGDAYDHVEVIYILKQIFDEHKTSDGILSGDGTGLETTRKQNYESTKKSGHYMTSIVDSREIVQTFDISGKQECRAMHELIKEVEGESLRLDAGFVDRELIREIKDLGMTPYVFPKKIIDLNGSLAWKNMYLELYYNVMEWLKEYYQREHAESFHSSFKRRNGLVTKRRPLSKLSQIAARIILHNRRRLSYFQKLANAS